MRNILIAFFGLMVLACGSDTNMHEFPGGGSYCELLDRCMTESAEQRASDSACTCRCPEDRPYAIQIYPSRHERLGMRFSPTGGIFVCVDPRS